MNNKLAIIFLAVSTLCTCPSSKAAPKGQKVPKKDCVKLAKQKIEKMFHKKVKLGNDSGDGPWSFAFDSDGCTYIISIWNDGKNGTCELSAPEKSEEPSMCEGEN